MTRNLKLSTLLGASGLLSAENLNMAYKSIIKRLRLFPAAFPAVISGACRLDGFSSMAALPNGSEVAFKEIIGLEGVDLASSFDDEYTVSTLTLYNHQSEDYGITGLDNMNASHATTPELFWFNGDIVCTNLDEAFFWIVGYPYPYFVMTNDDPYSAVHSYDIEDMVDTHGSSALYVDQTLMYPVVAKALAIHYEDNGDLLSSQGCDNAAIQYINIYNRNLDTASRNREEQYAVVEAMSI